MKTVLAVFGTRPDAIKMCPLVTELRALPDVCVRVCVTGQHGEMADRVLEEFGIEPDYRLHVMREGQSLTSLTVRVMEDIQPVLTDAAPSLVLVHGDTTSAFAAALACFYRRIPVGHVEAGLRTYDPRMPFPEEFDRRAVTLLASYHFAPTQEAVEALLREGIAGESVFLTGNTIIDALETSFDRRTDPELEAWAASGRMILLTSHRRENLGKPMADIFRAVRSIAEEYPDVRVLFPVHPNPAVRMAARTHLSDCERVKMTEPLRLPDFHRMLRRSYFIVTDSGGIQEEASALRKPVLVLRDKTERMEGVLSGGMRVVGTGYETVYEGCRQLLENAAVYKDMCEAVTPFLSGASRTIAGIVSEILRNGS